MKSVGRGAALAAAGALMTGGFVAAAVAPAHADNTAVSIEKAAKLSASKKIVNVKATVVCSDETTSAFMTAQVQQTNPGGWHAGRHQRGDLAGRDRVHR